MSDRRCKLGLRARIEIAQAVEAGASQRSVARAYAVSPATVHTIWHRWRVASADDRPVAATSEVVFDELPWWSGTKLAGRRITPWMAVHAAGR